MAFCIMGSLFQGTNKGLTPRSINTISSHFRCWGAASLLSFTRRHCTTTMASCIMENLFQGTNKGLTTRSSRLGLGAARHVSFTTANGSVPDATTKLSLSSSTLPFRTCPWLMLPSKDPMVTRFYSLEEERVIPIYKRDTMRMTTDYEMDDHPVCIGSSHGWLVYKNRLDFDLFLYNPMSDRTIKLPSIDTLLDVKPDLPYYQANLYIEKLILSSSPSEEEDRCIAMCTYGPCKRLAFCRPGHDTAWILLDESLKDYKQIAYSSKDKLFYSFNDAEELDCWDLREPLSPKRKLVAGLVKEEQEEDEKHHWTPLPKELCSQFKCSTEPYLIADPWSDDFLIIERFVATQIREDGTLVTDYVTPPGRLAYKTLFFQVYKVDFYKGVMKYKQSLNDRALFVGINHSFSLPADDFLHLRPNSIYFTDDNRARFVWEETTSHGGHDLGIFNYQDKVFESCYYPCDLKSIKRIAPTPVWFTPNPNYAFLFPS